MRRGILATREQLQRLRERIARKPFDKIYDFLRKRCALILQSAPITESHWRMTAQQGSYASALLAARTAQGRIMDLAVAYHMDRNHAYRDRAVEELKQLAAWSTWVDPCHVGAKADLCTAEAAAGAIIGLDWLYEDMTEADRLRVLHAVRHKAIEPYIQAVRGGEWWYEVYHAWNAVVNSGVGIAALAMSDELPIANEARRAAAAGLKHFFTALGREGGWDEGTGYWGYAMRYVLLFGEASVRLIDDRSIFHARGLDATGLFPIYFTPNGQPASFGDMPTVPLLGSMYALVEHFGLKEVTWWLDTYAFHRDPGTADWSAAGLAMLLRPMDADTPLAPDLKPLKVFNEIGWVAMADNWPRPALYLAAKAGDLSAHHSQHDMNSIQVQVDGEMLLTDIGHAPYSHAYLSSDERDEFYEVQACAHNTLTLGRRDHFMDAQGSVVEAQVGENYRWVACNAGTALGENNNFVRHIVMIVNPANHAGHMIFVLDELTNPTAQRVDVYWHTLGKLDFAPATLAGTIIGKQAGLCLATAANVPLSSKVESRQTASGRTENILKLSATGATKLLIATVFSVRPLTGKIELKKTTAEVRLRAGGVSLYFKGHRKHLQLDKVTG